MKWAKAVIPLHYFYKAYVYNFYISATDSS